MTSGRGSGRFPTFRRILWGNRDAAGLPFHLALLAGKDCGPSIQAISAAARTAPDLRAEVTDLIRDLNWRPQLVGAVALLMGHGDTSHIEQLWSALDTGSWVSPQLSATAFELDVHFVERARQRIESGCPIDAVRIGELDGPARHSAIGPESPSGHSAKLFASLCALVSLRASDAAWFRAALGSSTSQRLLALDSADGGAIAIRWRDAIRTALTRGGHG